MECPVCGERLRSTEKYGMEVDICPACKGLWLERGKLETIMSQAATQSSEQTSVTSGAPPAPAPTLVAQPQQHTEHDDHDHTERHGHHDDDDRHGRQRRRGSWIGDLLGGFGGED